MESVSGQSFDVVVVGGGVIGLAAAYELQKRGQRVGVLDKNAPGSGATGAAGGMLAPTCEAELAELPVVTLGFESLRRYPAWIRALESETGGTCAYRDEGTLWVAFNRDDEADLERLQAILSSKGLTVQPLSADEVIDREDFISSRVQSGLLVEEDHQLDPKALVDVLCEAISRRGGRVMSGFEAREIIVENGAARGVAGSDRAGRALCVRATSVLLAAGAWTTTGITAGGGAPWPGELKVRPIKGQVMRLHGEPLLRHVVRTPDIYMIPRTNGDLIIGATMEEMGFDIRPTAGAMMDFLRHAWRALPGIYELEVKECAAGLRPAARDHMPLVGPTEVDGLFVATGHHRDGVLLAPATAHHLADLITSGRLPEALLPFLPGRFERSAA